MYNENRNSALVAIEGIFDIVLNAVSLLAAYVACVIIYFKTSNVMAENRALVFVFLVACIQNLIYIGCNMYSYKHYIKRFTEISRIIRVNLLYYTFTTVVMLIIGKDEMKSFFFTWMLLAFILDTAILCAKRNILYTIVRDIRHKNFNVRKVIIVGDNSATIADYVREVDNDPESGVLVIGYVGDKEHEDLGCDRLGSFSDFGRLLDEHKPHDVVFAIDSYDKKKTIKMVNLCDDRCIKVYFIPVIYGFFKSSRQIVPVGSMPMINIHATPLESKFNAFLKRMVDIVGSLTLIVLSLPIMLVAVIGVRISSPGPILFRQQRVGKMGKEFTMVKFRSMRVNVDSDEAWTRGNDPRKTKFGTFLRKTSIDELPQLFNVLFGSMSLVGPRPEVPHFVQHFREIIPLYMVKHYVKPGLTGLAQIRGLRGDTSIEKRIEADIEYIENWSLLMDIGIIFKTPFKMINNQEKYTPITEDEETNEIVEEIQDMDENRDETQEMIEEPVKYRGKMLYVASNMTHINNFHLGYIDSFRKRGYDVKVMARGEGADYNVPFVKKFFSADNTACRSEIRRIVDREKFDVIILNTSLAAFHVRFALSKKDRPKIINIVHGYLFSKNTNFIRNLLLITVEKLVASRTDSIIVMNDADRQIALKYKLCRGSVYVSKGMGASVRDVITPPEKIREQNLCQDKYVIAFVGELSARKNQEFLIRAMNYVKEKIPNAVLWLIGDGLAKDYLHAVADMVDLSDSVFFFGQRNDACDYMRACDLYVSASAIEGMPFNIIEAMGCGKTVLASSIKGHEDLIVHGINGFLYKYGNIKDYVNKVFEIYKGSLSVKQSDIQKRYSEYANDKVFSDTLGIIKEAIQKSEGTRR